MMKKVRFIVPQNPYFNVYSYVKMPPWGILSVASSVKNTGRYEVEVIDENNFNGVIDHRKIQRSEPADFVGLYGGMSSSALRLYELASFYHSQGIPVLTGGAHVVAEYEEAFNNGVDVVVKGEGEHSAVEVLDAWSHNHPLDAIEGIIFKTDGAITKTQDRKPIDDLDSLVPPDWSLLKNQVKKMRVVPLCRTRGCNFNCEFCCVKNHLGCTRWTSPEYIFKQIVALSNQHHKLFFFVDDHFAQDRAGTIKLCNLIADFKKKNHRVLKFIVQVRSEVARDEELLRAMRAAGVTTLCIGLESPIDEELRNMNKGQTCEKIKNAIHILHRYGFYIHGMFIFGYPTFASSRCALNISLEERANRYIDFIRKSKIDTIQISKPVPLPGTVLREKLAKANRLYPPPLVKWDKYDGNWLTFQPDEGIEARELQQQATRIYRKFYRGGVILKVLYLIPISPLDWVYYFSKRFWQLSIYHLKNIKAKKGHRHFLRTSFNIFKESLAQAERAVRKRWRNAVWRMGGSILLKKWIKEFKAQNFLSAIEKAKKYLKLQPFLPHPHDAEAD